MIQSFKHKGVEKFFFLGSTVGIQSVHRAKLRLQLAMLEAAEVVQDMDKPGWRLHKMKGKRAEIWVIEISGNWRLTFKFKDRHAHEVNYEDYH